MTARLLVVVLALGAQAASGQVGSIAGVVRMGGSPAMNARVLLDSIREARSDSAGRFRFDSVAVGRHRVQTFFLGATPARHDVGVIADYTSRVDVTLEKIVVLDSVLVEGSTVRQGFVRAFEDRKRVGLGKFLDSTEVRRYAETYQALSFLPGVKLKKDTILFGPAPGCLPSVWIDNVYIGASAMDQAELKTIGTRRIVAIEVYTHSVPQEFQPLRGTRNTGCGALVVWTTRLWPQGKPPR